MRMEWLSPMAPEKIELPAIVFSNLSGEVGPRESRSDSHFPVSQPTAWARRATD